MSNPDDQKTYGLFSTAINAKLIRGLETTGANVFQFPPVEAEIAVPGATAADYLNNLTSFDWVIFPDVFAVEYFLHALENHEIDFFELDSVNVLALGEAVSDRLRFVQLHADLIPSSVEAENIFQTLSNFISRNSVSDLKFLVPKETFARLEITKKLIEKNAGVIELPIYNAKINDRREVAKLKVLLAGGAIDEFIFSSAEDLISLEYIFLGESIPQILSEIEVSATDEITMRALKEHNQRSKFRRP